MVLSGWDETKKINLNIPAQTNELIDFPVLLNITTPQRPTSVDDDFTGDNGDIPNELLWCDYYHSGASVASININNNKLSFSLIYSNDAGSRYSSKYTLSGDFSIEVDVLDFSYSGTSSYLGLNFSSTGGGGGFLGFGHLGGSVIFRSNLAGANGTAARSNNYGKIKVSRVGSVITTFGKDGDEDWVQVQSVSEDSDDIKIQVAAYTGDNNTLLTGNLDNFTLNSGTVVWPETTPHGSGVTNFDCSEIFDELQGNDDYTKLLIHSNSTDGSTTFIDSSLSKHTITAVGNAKHEIDQSKFGPTSIYFDGTGDWLSVPHSDDWEFGSGDFTIDCWVYPTAYAGRIICKGDEGVNGWLFNYSDTGTVEMQIFSEDSLSGTEVAPLNTWSHVAAVVVDNVCYIFINGTLDVFGDVGNVRTSDGWVLGVGKLSMQGDLWDFQGYIDELRISKGIARWTKDFTPPTRIYSSVKSLAIECKDTGEQCYIEIEDWNANTKKAALWVKVPLINGTIDTYTKLLISSDSTDGSSDFDDSSGSRHTITATGDVHHEIDQAKFGSTSMYFDGTTDYLSVPDSEDWNFDTNNFTIDCWVYFLSGAVDLPIFSQLINDDNRIQFSWDQSSGKLWLYVINGGTLYIEYKLTYTPVLNIWIHICLERDSTSIRLFLDGIEKTLEIIHAIGTQAIHNYAAPFRIGFCRHGGADQSFLGYIDEFRVSKGVARWTENFTPPTYKYMDEPTSNTTLVLFYDSTQKSNDILDSDSYTKLLISSNTTDGSVDVVDSSGNNHSITVVDNTHHEINQSKFGTTSIYFDGAGDYLSIPDSTDFNLSTGSWTIDFWIYSSSSTYALFFGKNNSSGSYEGWHIKILDTGMIGFVTNDNSTLMNTTNAVPAYTWTHVALVYSGTVLEIFIGGESGGTATGSIQNYATTLTIGRLAADYSSFQFNGYLDEIRISKGIERWTEDFTPPIKSYNAGFIGNTGEEPAQLVWDNNFVAVYHMNQDPSGGTNCIIDSTVNTNHGTPNGMVSDDLVDKLVGKAIDFDGTDDGVTVLYNNDFDLDNVTLEILSYNRTLGSFAGGVAKGEIFGGATGYSYKIDFHNGNSSFNCTIGGSSSSTGPTSIIQNDWNMLAGTYNGAKQEFYHQGVKIESTDISGTLHQDNKNFMMGETSGGDYNFDGLFGDIKVSSTARSVDWLTVSNLSLIDNLITFYYIKFIYNNSYPKDNVKMYGLSQTLQSDVTISGVLPSSTYDTNFYHSTGTQVGGTVSGTTSGNTVQMPIDTLSGINYSWYLETTSSGVTNRSPDYNFYVRYACSGICTTASVPASGINVRLYRKTNGDLINETTTSGDGIFSIDTNLNEEHYAVALHPDTDINALVYDHLTP